MANPKLLAMRDPALAALMGAGVFAGGAQSDFGRDFEFGYDEPDFTGEDDDDFGYSAAFAGDDDDDWGEDDDDFGASPRRRQRRPAPRAAMAAWKKLRAAKANTGRRVRMLEPNHQSTVKVERYSFSISQTLVLGTGSGIAMTGQPDTTIRPQRLTINAPSPMFAEITEIKVANVSVSVGPGAEDAYFYNPLGQGMSLDMPTLSPANRATILGTYTGFVPPGFVGGTTVTLSASFKGPAAIVA